MARKIVKIIGKNKRELNLPVLLNLAYKFYTLFPKLADKLAGESLIISKGVPYKGTFLYYLTECQKFVCFVLNLHSLF